MLQKESLNVGIGGPLLGCFGAVHTLHHNKLND